MICRGIDATSGSYVEVRSNHHIDAVASAGPGEGDLFIAPGWIFGASIDLFSAIAGRLAVVLGILLVAGVAIWFAVNTVY